MISPCRTIFAAKISWVYFPCAHKNSLFDYRAASLKSYFFLPDFKRDFDPYFLFIHFLCFSLH